MHVGGMFGAARRCLDETVKYTLERDAYQEVLGRKEGVGGQILMKA